MALVARTNNCVNGTSVVRAFAFAISIAIAIALSGCSSSVSSTLEGHECSNEGRCLEGFVCSDDWICLRPSSFQREAATRARADEMDADAATKIVTRRLHESAPPAEGHRPEAVSGVATADAGTDSGVPMDSGRDEPPSSVETMTSTSAGAGGMSSAGVGGMQPAAAGASGAGVGGMPAEAAGASAGASGAAGSGAGGRGGAGGSAGVAGAAGKPSAAGTSGAPPGGVTEEPAPPPAPGGPAMQCEDDLTRCGNACVDTLSNVNHCGKCDHKCSGEQQCLDGKCKKAGNGNGNGGPGNGGPGNGRGPG